MMPVKVSVIVPVFNQEAFIGRCLRSLLEQNLKSEVYEIIVVNDGSTDLTSYALSQFSNGNDTRIKIIQNDTNLGLPASINKGIRASEGTFIVRVDSDDFVNQNFLSVLLLYLETNYDCDAVACDYLLISDKEIVLGRCKADANPIACGIMFRRDHIFNVGLYDETFIRQEDREFRIRFEKKYVIERLKIPMYRYRRHNNNLTNDLESMQTYLNRVNEKHGDRR